MRYLVTPTFSEKVTSAGKQVLSSAAFAMSYFEESTKQELLDKALLLDGDPNIYALRDKNFRVLFTLGVDDEGDYALLLDLIVHGDTDTPNPWATRNPTLNMMLDPHRNMMIDPRRNMMIDPRRNMMIDPRRNMTIDPRQNMMIDPSRNMGIDPKRNWQIDPHRNTAWSGPLLYNISNKQVGFVIRANEKVALLFDSNSNFESSIISAGEKNLNLFGRDGGWTSFMVRNGADGYNQFDLNGQWIGFLVGVPQLE